MNTSKESLNLQNTGTLYNAHCDITREIVVRQTDESSISFDFLLKLNECA